MLVEIILVAFGNVSEEEIGSEGFILVCVSKVTKHLY